MRRHWRVVFRRENDVLATYRRIRPLFRRRRRAWRVAWLMRLVVIEPLT